MGRDPHGAGCASREEAGRRSSALFGRRKGHRLRPHRAGLLTTLLPRLALDLSVPSPPVLASLFAARVDAVRLEIGFGAGEHLCAQAIAHPDSGFIGCEPFVNGMAKMLAEIEAQGLANVRLHHGDAREVLAWLPQACLTGIDLLYPDPWPKRRHWKRRFISDRTLAAIARVLRPGGLLRFATDSADYAHWTLLRGLRSPALAWTAACADDWRRPWPDFSRTRYEEKARALGRAPLYLVFRRL